MHEHREGQREREKQTPAEEDTGIMT